MTGAQEMSLAQGDAVTGSALDTVGHKRRRPVTLHVVPLDPHLAVNSSISYVGSRRVETFETPLLVHRLYGGMDPHDTQNEQPNPEEIKEFVLKCLWG